MAWKEGGGLITQLLQTRYSTLTVAISFFLGISIAVLFHTTLWRYNPSDQNYAVREGEYNFINPLLSCNFSENQKSQEFAPIENKMQDYISATIKNGNATNISVYFRGLDSGNWFGTNENQLYAPASLLKVPLMIAYLREARIDQTLLDKQLVYRQDTDLNVAEAFKPAKTIEDGHTYTVRQLLEYMIEYSDNNATTLLQKNISADSLGEVFSDLGLTVSHSWADDTVSPKDYAYVFRLLYNATYLGKTMSQYALQLLSSPDFPQGIESGLPSKAVAAQKFGERSIPSINPATGTATLVSRELHDCGIIYYPANPYLLCIMTRGNDFTKLSKIISDISTMIYQETDSGVLKREVPLGN